MKNAANHILNPLHIRCRLFDAADWLAKKYDRYIWPAIRWAIKSR